LGDASAKLQGPESYFLLCRDRYRVVHANQSQDAWARAIRRANKIKQRLGGEPGMAAFFPKKPKPKSMWRRTFSHCSSKRSGRKHWPTKQGACHFGVAVLATKLTENCAAHRVQLNCAGHWAILLKIHRGSQCTGDERRKGLFFHGCFRARSVGGRRLFRVCAFIYEREIRRPSTQH